MTDIEKALKFNEKYASLCKIKKISKKDRVIKQEKLEKDLKKLRFLLDCLEGASIDEALEKANKEQIK